eukprot:3577342-Alexandrium_andersonii.AAC.1
MSTTTERIQTRSTAVPALPKPLRPLALALAFATGTGARPCTSFSRRCSICRGGRAPSGRGHCVPLAGSLLAVKTRKTASAVPAQPFKQNARS